MFRMPAGRSLGPILLPAACGQDGDLITAAQATREQMDRMMALGYRSFALRPGLHRRA